MGNPAGQLSRHARDCGGLTAVRGWLLLVLVSFAWFGTGEARAQTWCAAGDGCTRAQAWSACEAYRDTLETTHSPHFTTQCGRPNAAQNFYQVWQKQNCCSPSWTGPAFRWESSCPAGFEWDEDAKTCACEPGTTYRPDGTCKSCESLNSEPGFGDQEVLRPFRERCLGGCQFRAKPNFSTCSLIAGGASGTEACTGQWEFTGAACSVGGGDPPMLQSPIPGEPGGPDVSQRECLNPGGGGMNVCVKPSGQHCHSASTGREICWNPGETGDKGDGAVLQTRGPGSTAKDPANPATSTGDPYQSTGQTATVTTTRNGSTITTTTANFTTVNGTDADNQRDGSAEGEDSGSATGGGDCSSPPVVSDPALEMVANQAWATRCAVEAGNTAKVTGDVGDCASPFSVEGDNANAEQLRAMRVQICGSLDSAANDVASGAVDGIDSAIAAADGADPDVPDGDFDDAADPANWREIRDINGELADLDASGFIGGASCPIAPSVSVRGTSLGINFNPICNMFINMSGLLIALAYIVAARIIAGVK